MKYLIAVFTLLYSGMLSADVLTVIMQPNPKEAECEANRVDQGTVCSAVAVIIKEPLAAHDAMCIGNLEGGRMCFILRVGHVKHETGGIEVYPTDIHIFEGPTKSAEL